MLELEGAWVHVKISGASRGWIRRAQLDLPAEYTTAAEQAADPAPAAAGLFNISKDETTAFGGKWPPLQGKKVRVIWLEPASPTGTSTAREKLAYAKALFEVVHGTEVVGRDAGWRGDRFRFGRWSRIATTLSSLKQLADGAIGRRILEAVFA